jgi:hypothetical protein
MISVRISTDVKNAVVGSAEYTRHPIPQHPTELSQHSGVRLRMSTYGGLYDWEFVEASVVQRQNQRAGNM